MNQSLIVLGDKTDHGGTVIGGALASDTHGKRIARIGDMVACPRCKGVFPIAQGDASLMVDGAAAAYHGCKVACGAMLISSQGATTTEISGGVGAGAGGSAITRAIAQRFGSIGAGLVAGYEDAAVEDEDKRFQKRFQVLDRVTGAPIVGKEVRVRSTSGQYLTGSTDAEGYTQWVEREAAEALAFDLIGQGSDSGTP